MIDFNDLFSILFITALFAYVVDKVISGITKIFHNLNGDNRLKIDFKQ